MYIISALWELVDRDDNSSFVVFANFPVGRVASVVVPRRIVCSCFRVRGVYCVTNSDAPYCSRTNAKGSPYCCASSSSRPANAENMSFDHLDDQRTRPEDYNNWKRQRKEQTNAAKTKNRNVLILLSLHGMYKISLSINRRIFIFKYNYERLNVIHNKSLSEQRGRVYYTSTAGFLAGLFIRRINLEEFADRRTFTIYVRTRVGFTFFVSSGETIRVFRRIA